MRATRPVIEEVAGTTELHKTVGFVTSLRNSCSMETYKAADLLVKRRPLRRDEQEPLNIFRPILHSVEYRRGSSKEEYRKLMQVQ